MIVRYELRDMEAANQFTAFNGKDEAIAVITEYLRLNGVAAVSQFVLGALYRDKAGGTSLLSVPDGDDVVASVRAGAMLDLTS